VAERAADYARRMGLPPDLVRAVELAGRTHDLGKADARFQTMLHGGDPLRAEAWPELLAKSGMNPADRALSRAAQVASGWPGGMRHEAISATALAAVVKADPTLVKDLDLDLVLHLVSTHHGNGRPLLPAVLDESPVDVRAQVPGHGTAVQVGSGKTIDWSAPARFERLGARYGWWGLALLESVVRLADIACSKEYETEAVS
jgi:CRISPR-associated endonuclease/helicase Cas3